MRCDEAPVDNSSPRRMNGPNSSHVRLNVTPLVRLHVDESLRNYETQKSVSIRFGRSPSLAAASWRKTLLVDACLFDSAEKRSSTWTPFAMPRWYKASRRGSSSFVEATISFPHIWGGGASRVMMQRSTMRNREIGLSHHEGRGPFPDRRHVLADAGWGEQSNLLRPRKRRKLH